MEKYSQFRDKGASAKSTCSTVITTYTCSQFETGTAIAPFLPVPPPPVGIIWYPIHLFLFCVRTPFVVAFSLLYFLGLEFIPVGRRLKYAVLWLMLGIPGVWWVDLQVDGVKRGYVRDHA
jgi:hypothetical protein